MENSKDSVAHNAQASPIRLQSSWRCKRFLSKSFRRWESDPHTLQKDSHSSSESNRPWRNLSSFLSASTALALVGKLVATLSKGDFARRYGSPFRPITRRLAPCATRRNMKPRSRSGNAAPAQDYEESGRREKLSCSKLAPAERSDKILFLFCCDAFRLLSVPREDETFFSVPKRVQPGGVK